MAERIYVGEVSAYALARKYGYTGTEEEWAREQAAAGENARIARENAEQTTADRETVEHLVTELTEAVDTAVENVEGAAQDRMDAISEMGQGFLDTIAEDGAAQIKAVESTGEEWQNSVREQGEAAEEAVSTVRKDAETAIANERQDALTAISENRGAAADAIKKEETASIKAVTDAKNAAQTAISTDKTNAQDAIAADRSEAVKAISDDRSAAESAIAADQKTAQDAIAADKAAAVKAIADDRDAAEGAIAADKKSALDAISADRAAAVKAVGDDRAAAESAIATGKDDAVSAITNKQTAAQDAIAADKDDALSAFHTERDAVLTAIEEKTDAQVTRIPDVAQLSEQIAAMQENVIPRVDSIEGEQIVQNNRLDELESHPAIDPSVERRLENLEAAAKGYLYREDVNTDAAYEKRVENDVLPWATLDKIGGKTIVMNQLIGDTYPKTVDGEAYEQTIDDKAESVRIDKIGARTLVWNQLVDASKAVLRTLGGTTLSKVNNELVLNGTPDISAYHICGSLKEPMVLGHKYYVQAAPKAYGTSGTYMHIRVDGGTGGAIFTAREPSVIVLNSVNAPDVSRSNVYIQTMFKAEDPYTFNNVVVKPMIVDLTSMGLAEVINTPEEFHAFFPDDYYPYCEPELRSFGAHGVVSRGANLCAGLTLGVGVNTSTGVEIPNANFATSDYIPIDGRKAIYTSGLTDKLTNLTLFYDANKQYIGRTGSSVLTEKTILYGAWLNNGTSYNEKACYMRLTQYKLDTNTGTIEDADGLCIMVNQESESMEYAPYFRCTIDLSALVQKYFPNGMKAAGTVHDEIDLEHGKAIQRIGVFDFTGTYSVIKDGNYCMTVTASAFNPAIKPTPNSETVGNVICSDYVPYPFREVYNKQNDMTVAVYINGNTCFQSTELYGNVLEFKKNMEGKLFFYELEEPIETPIDPSDLLPILLTTEQGGSITFANAYGDGFRVPVPYSDTLMLTEWTQPLDATHKYSMNGELVIGASSVDVIGGEDNVIDLTKAFGVGNEPSNPREVLPGKYEQNGGALLNCEVKEVVSKGVNLFDKSTANDDFMMKWSDGSLYPEVGAFTSDYIPIEYGKTYYFHQNTSQCFLYDGEKRAKYIYKAAGFTEMDGSAGGVASQITIDKRDAAFMRFSVRAVYGGLSAKDTLMFTTGESADKYVPYFVPITIEFASFVSKYFPDGMHSAGEAYDSFEQDADGRWWAVKRIAMCEMNSGTRVTGVGTATTGINYATISVSGSGRMLGDTKNIVTSEGDIAMSGQAAKISGGIRKMGTDRFTRYDDTYTSIENVQNAISERPITIYCELEEPIRTLVTEDFPTDLNVEPGGSLTFTNDHNDDFHMPLPNQETFIVNLRGETK